MSELSIDANATAELAAAELAAAWFTLTAAERGQSMQALCA
jgi:hypothetical protein